LIERLRFFGGEAFGVNVRVRARQQDAEVRRSPYLGQRVDHCLGHRFHGVFDTADLLRQPIEETVDRRDRRGRHQRVRTREVSVDRLTDDTERLRDVGDADLRTRAPDQIDCGGDDSASSFLVVFRRTPAPPAPSCHCPLPRLEACRLRTP
jgi:hypothetical protein